MRKYDAENWACAYHRYVSSQERHVLHSQTYSANQTSKDETALRLYITANTWSVLQVSSIPQSGRRVGERQDRQIDKRTADLRDIFSQQFLLILVLDFNQKCLFWVTITPCRLPIQVACYQHESVCQRYCQLYNVQYTIQCQCTTFHKRHFHIRNWSQTATRFIVLVFRWLTVFK